MAGNTKTIWYCTRRRDRKKLVHNPKRVFAYRLALQLGYVNVDSMLSEIPERLFLEWIAYYRIEPFGVERDDYRAGIIASTIANVNRKKSQKAFTPKDFMPVKKITDWRSMRSSLLNTFGYTNG